MGLKSYQLSEWSSVTLDATRAFASQLVLFGHAISYLGLLKNFEPPHFPYLQNIAVMIFFFLSGFLICHSTLKRRENPSYGFIDYWIERFSRIYSAYFPCLILIFLLDLVLIFSKPDLYAFYRAFDLKTFVGNMLMLQYFPLVIYRIDLFGSARPLWTLAIEWWIYMAFGWALLVKPKTSWSRVLKVVLLFPLLLVPIQNFGGSGNGLTFVWIWGGMSVLLIPYLSRQASFKLILGAIGFLGLAVYRVSSTKTAYDVVFGGLLSAFFLFMLSYLQTKETALPALYKKWSKFFSSYSFTLFLLHYSMLDVLTNLFRHNVHPVVLLFLSFILCNGLSFLVAQKTENKRFILSDRLKRITGSLKETSFLGLKLG